MIPGVRVGHVTDPIGLTGVTVVLPDQPAVGGVAVPGRASGVHGLDFLDSSHLVPTIDGIVLSGGSAFGLESIWGVMQWLEEQGVGFRTRHTVVPHVAGAILYDLGVGDWRARPDRAMGYAAAAAARHGPVAQGNVGAGTGATVGKLHGAPHAMRGGLGCATATLGEVTLGAIVAVNAVGDVRDPDTGRLIAGTRDAPDGRRLIDTRAALAAGVPAPRFQPANTTIGVVVTSAALDKTEAARLARLATDGFHHALSPPHLDTDGDTLFCLSVGDHRTDPEALGRAAADVVARAIVNAVRASTSLPGLPAASDL
ncbi:MAG TPA: P1 family peptidase [Candidatus Methylomirabilis sp.]|nr:P1 family peptidase [Candidatus Methylomirabilis sp.]